MNRYSSSNLTEFEFHDAWAEEVHWEGDVLTCRVKQCSLHANALENPYSQDMELNEAVLTFSGFHRISNQRILSARLGSEFSKWDG